MRNLTITLYIFPFPKQLWVKLSSRPSPALCLSKPSFRQLLRPSALDEPWESWKSGLGKAAWREATQPTFPSYSGPPSPLCNLSRGGMSSFLANGAQREKPGLGKRILSQHTHAACIRDPFHLTERQGHHPQGFPSTFPTGVLRFMLVKKSFPGG